MKKASLILSVISLLTISPIFSTAEAATIEQTLSKAIFKIGGQVSPTTTQSNFKEYNDIANKKLSTAVRNGVLEEVQSAFAEGANPNYFRDRYYAPFNTALIYNSQEIVQCFIDNGVDINFKSSTSGTNPSSLWTAVINKRLDIVELLLNIGADQNITNANGDTVLFWSVREDNPIFLNITKLLIEKGIDINKSNKNGNTPLIIACREGSLENIKLLLENGADPNKKNFESKKPLDFAIKAKNNNIINLLQPITN